MGDDETEGGDDDVEGCGDEVEGGGDDVDGGGEDDEADDDGPPPTIAPLDDLLTLSLVAALWTTCSLPPPPSPRDDWLKPEVELDEELILLRKILLILETLGTLNLSQMPSFMSLSLISQAKIPGSRNLSSRMNITTCCCVCSFGKIQGKYIS